MAENKTQLTRKSVEAFLNAIPDDGRRNDCFEILRILKTQAGAEPKMWGESIVGFGDIDLEVLKKLMNTLSVINNPGLFVFIYI